MLFTAPTIMTKRALDPSTNAWANQVVTNGGSVSAARKALINNYILALKNHGLWTGFDRLWVTAEENSVSGRTDLVGLSLATTSATAPTFTADDGFLGLDLSNSRYLTNGYLPHIGTTQFQQNSGHISVWCFNNVASAGVSTAMGVITASCETAIYPRTNGNQAIFAVNAGGYVVVNGVGDSSGHLIANRTDASTQAAYRNGSLYGSASVASNGLVANQFFILQNSNGFGWPGIISLASIGRGFTASEITNFYNDTRTYMTAVAVP
jgi:hypothetical protein